MEAVLPSRLSPEVLRSFREIAGGKDVLSEEVDLQLYSYESAIDRALPSAVIFPKTARQISEIIKICRKNSIPFVARGAGTNLCGGAVPLKGGVVLALAPLNHILEIDTGEGLAVVEPGVVNLRLQQELEKLDRFYAPDPASFRVCTLGGNVAENAGGPRCLKYGTTTNHEIGRAHV